MLDTRQLLTTARWLHQRDANAKTVLWATGLVLAMATAMAALVGALLTASKLGVLVGAALPPAHTLKTWLQRKSRYREAQRALRKTDPALIQTVHEWNAELLDRGRRYEIRTPRKIQTLHVLEKEDLILTHLDFPQWYPHNDPELEALVKKARPC